ncbi:kinase-like domain-containing protein [Mycena sp. CBHHK59/15]|nr:kinase-like domain-containing protein [Mycena sp. CBHHK59/15]
MIGKGGSSRVFRVLNSANELYAIKRVSLDKTDSETMNGYMNEIALLKRLDGNSRIIRLIDSEVKAGPGGSKGHLFLVMECGEIDLARLISEQMKEPLNMVWVAYYWQQMLQAVHVIHEEKIVHSDLKPANFVLVRGQLKLIDFGIANAIANDTTNIQRDHQIGTVNYMSPEAIELPDGMRRLKVGRASDVWSLGCILYQMVYGHPPFQHLSVYQKMKAIPDNAYNIDFPEFATPTLPAPPKQGSGSSPATPPTKLDHLKRPVRRDVIDCMQRCLCRAPKERAMIPQLMEQDWLAMKEVEIQVPVPPPTPEPEEPLKEDETVINPYFMRQLLEYGMNLGKNQSGPVDEDHLLKEATVRSHFNGDRSSH